MFRIHVFEIIGHFFPFNKLELMQHILYKVFFSYFLIFLLLLQIINWTPLNKAINKIPIPIKTGPSTKTGTQVPKS